MDFLKYSQEIIKFDQTPKIGAFGISAYLFKLVGELQFELAQARGREAIGLEIGDCVWYISRICSLLDEEFPDNTSLRVMGSFRLSVLADWHTIDAYSSASISVLVGEVCENYGKLLRDGEVRTNDFLNIWMHFLLQSLNYLFAIARSNELTIGNVLAKNVAKLQSRLDRGVIRGTGDYR